MRTDGSGNTRPRLSRREFLATIGAVGVGSAAAGAIRSRPDPAVAAPRRGGTLRVADIGEPLTLDTVSTTDELTAGVTVPLFEELFAFDATWRAQPFLVESYTVSPNALIYTLTLRRDVSFHNDKGMTADDVVASLNRWGAISPRGSSVYQHVDRVTGN